MYDKITDIFEEKRSAGHRVDQGLFIASVLLTLWGGYKLFRGNQIDTIVAADALDGGSDFIGILFKNGDKVAYELLK